jgi:hypothetical protein
VTGPEWDRLAGHVITITYKGQPFRDVRPVAGRDDFPFSCCDRPDTGFAWIAGKGATLDITRTELVSVDD